MRTIISFFVVALLGFIVLSCGGLKTTQSTKSGEVPEWFQNPPQDPNYLFATNTATSRDLQLAIDKAVTGARAEIGRQTEVRIKSLQKRFEEEVGLGEDAQLLQQFTQASKTVVATSLSGSRVSKQKQVRDGNLWRAYVLVEYPIGAASQALLEQIKTNEQMHTRFRASETFKELEDEVKEEEERKKQQEQP